MLTNLFYYVIMYISNKERTYIMLHKNALIIPVNNGEKAEIGTVTGHSEETYGVAATLYTNKYYHINNAVVLDSRVKFEGDTITIDEVTYTIDSILVDENTVILMTDYDEIYTFEPTDIYYCDSCKCLHFADAPMVDDLEDEDDNDFKLGHFAGYMSAVHDFYEWINNDDSLMTEALGKVGHGYFSDMVRDTDALIKFYYIMDDLKAEKEKKPENIPQYTHEELVKLIGHEFAEV